MGNTADVWDPTPDIVLIAATDPPPILPPVADAGLDISLTEGETAHLDGSASWDPGGLVPLTYAWSIQSLPSGSSAVLATPTAVSTDLVTDIAGDYALALSVTNSAGKTDSTPASVVVHAAERPPEPPIADAGPDHRVLFFDEISFDASASTDPQGLPIAAWAWTLTGTPVGSTAQLSNPNAQAPTLFTDQMGEYTALLNVQNQAGLWDATPDEVTLTAAPTFYFELTWDSVADLDLHMLNGSTGLFRNGDCTWCNKTLRWGAPGPADDPFLDIDDVDFGPEVATIEDPSPGTYSVKVHYYGQDHLDHCVTLPCPPSTATVKLYLHGQLAGTWTHTLLQRDDVWNVASVTWPAGTIATEDTMGTDTSTWCR